ncbi:hypothetical protein EJ05DRAFT_134294 [Pseudovirgaria hyperparasitica]|uniref:Uncharacterized protein n=1 Tax=Pseudovirgaria hyperparasitica TaxID=470096 RepID=A0A6A6VY95_9PEZI|nr:uncharacterized protein EJ05DRAFT_134294 [Pseudovirgaria hyperparasitica]KAF2754819.1 hypothetical protein EJ05DRAFT_134294 [Pseudovirgaria hyperparasitica]
MSLRLIVHSAEQEKVSGTGGVARIRIRAGPPSELTSNISSQDLRHLRLKPGSQAWQAIKRPEPKSCVLIMSSTTTGKHALPTPSTAWLLFHSIAKHPRAWLVSWQLLSPLTYCRISLGEKMKIHWGRPSIRKAHACHFWTFRTLSNYPSDQPWFGQ